MQNVGITMVKHDQTTRLYELRLDADLGLTDHFGVALSLPLRIFSTDIRYVDLFGDEVALRFPNIHHRDETITGLGDPWLLGTAATSVGRLGLGARAGVTLPFGHTVDDPFVLGDMGREHEHYQAGTGTFDLLLGADASYRFPSFTLAASVLTKQTTYANSHDYQAGDRYGLALRADLPLGRFTPRLALDASHESAERWAGVIPEGDGNAGRTDLLAGLGLRWQLAPTAALDATLRLPVYQHIEGGQIDLPAILELSFAYDLDLFAPPHDDDDDDHDHAHDHDHHHHDGDGDGDDHDHDAVSLPESPDIPAGADVADATTDGSAVDLAPVPGKLVIYDFWAPWCEPCKQLTPALYQLAAQHPDHLAIRRINVVDWDSPVAKRYLTESPSLPHLAIVGPDGTVLARRSASPEVLIQLAEALLLSTFPPP